MRYCEVLGSVTQTIHHPDYDGQKLLVVQPLDEQSKPTGNSFLAVDNVQAGPGDRVLVLMEGNGIRQIFGKKQLPIQSLIVGIVDAAELG
ncbi:MAG: EutN/CcmL family microcompartment protein [Myxococcota bacterium]